MVLSSRLSRDVLLYIEPGTLHRHVQTKAVLSKFCQLHVGSLRHRCQKLFLVWFSAKKSFTFHVICYYRKSPCFFPEHFDFRVTNTGHDQIYANECLQLLNCKRKVFMTLHYFCLIRCCNDFFQNTVIYVVLKIIKHFKTTEVSLDITR